jgi:hypothetical protein
MDASLILENLEKLDKIHQFISILEIRFSDQEIEREKIRSIKKLLNTALTELAFAINKKLRDEARDINKDSLVSTQISEILNICNDSFFVTEIKNFQLLVMDLKNIEKILKNCELEQNPVLINGNNTEITKLKEKILIIISERII